MYNEIMESINKIDSTIMEAEVSVASAMIDAYTKAAMIMEYCDNDAEVETFGIIQECFIVEEIIDVDRKPKDGDSVTDKKKNIFERLLAIVKRLLGRFIRFMKSLFQKKSKAEANYELLENWVEETIKVKFKYDWVRQLIFKTGAVGKISFNENDIDSAISYCKKIDEIYDTLYNDIAARRMNKKEDFMQIGADAESTDEFPNIYSIGEFFKIKEDCVFDKNGYSIISVADNLQNIFKNINKLKEETNDMNTMNKCIICLQDIKSLLKKLTYLAETFHIISRIVDKHLETLMEDVSRSK